MRQMIVNMLHAGLRSAGMVNLGPAARGGKTAQNQDYKSCCRFHAPRSYPRPIDVCRTLVVPEIGWAVYFASSSRRMPSADQPDSLPGTRGGRRFATKNRYANSSTGVYFSKSSFNSSRFAVSPADGTRAAAAVKIGCSHQ